MVGDSLALTLTRCLGKSAPVFEYSGNADARRAQQQLASCNAPRSDARFCEPANLLAAQFAFELTAGIDSNGAERTICQPESQKGE
jgi:hypothetical protein